MLLLLFLKRRLKKCMMWICFKIFSFSRLNAPNFQSLSPRSSFVRATSMVDLCSGSVPECCTYFLFFLIVFCFTIFMFETKYLIFLVLIFSRNPNNSFFLQKKYCRFSHLMTAPCFFQLARTPIAFVFCI